MSRIRPYGEGALLVEPDGPVPQLFARLDRHRPDGVLDLVPAEATLLVAVDPRRLPLDRASAWVREVIRGMAMDRCWSDNSDPSPSPEDLVVPVVYDGADLDDVARLTGLTPAEVVAAHTGTPWVVAFTGFAPGFGYLTGGDPRLRVPRHDVPRPRVPAGSVGLAGRYSGVYPRASPGGWRLIGRTGLTLWDAAADPPAELRPGRRVRFEVAG